MARYFRVKYENGFQRQHTIKVATIQGTPADDPACKLMSFNTGFNGCKLVSFEEISQEEYRGGGLV